MGRSQNLGTLVCAGVSYSEVLSYHMILSYEYADFYGIG